MGIITKRAACMPPLHRARIYSGDWRGIRVIRFIDGSPCAIRCIRGSDKHPRFISNWNIDRRGAPVARPFFNFYPSVAFGATSLIKGGKQFRASHGFIPLNKGDVAKRQGVSASTQGVYIWQPDESISSGVYLVRATTDDGKQITKRIVYLK